MIINKGQSISVKNKFFTPSFVVCCNAAVRCLAAAILLRKTSPNSYRKEAFAARKP